MTRPENPALEKKAKRFGASAVEITALLDVLAESHKSALAALDRTEREIAVTRAYFSAKLARPPTP